MWTSWHKEQVMPIQYIVVVSNNVKDIIYIILIDSFIVIDLYPTLSQARVYYIAHIYV